MRNILYLVDKLTLGGAQVVLLNLVSHLNKRYCPFVIALFEDGIVGDKLREKGIFSKCLEMHSPYQLRTFLRFLPQITDFAKNNTLNGKAMSSISRVKNNLANMAIEVEVSRMISYRIGYLQSKGEVFNKEASMGKMFGTEMVQRIYSAGMDMLGLYGTLQQGSKYAPLNGRIQKGYLASYSATIAAGTSEIQRNVVATRGLGLPRA